MWIYLFQSKIDYPPPSVAFNTDGSEAVVLVLAYSFSALAASSCNASSVFSCVALLLPGLGRRS